MKRSSDTAPSRNPAFKPDVIKAIDVKEAGHRLLEFLSGSLPDLKRTRLKQMLAHNQVAVNGNPERAFDRELQPGDVVKVNFIREFKVFRHRRLRIVYEDEHIIVIEKGYGLLSIGTDTKNDGTAYSILKDYVKWHNPANKIFIVHRLDRDTSGLMMFAKTMEAKEAMQHNWNNMVLNRKYVAVVEGIPDPDADTIRNYLAENSRYEVFATDNPQEGKLAVTRYRTLRAGHNYAMLEVELDTGRKNQIRVHMAGIGHPISGDRKYGAEPSPIHRLALHAATLRFVHPVTRKEMDFSCAIPSSFVALAKK